MSCGAMPGAVLTDEQKRAWTNQNVDADLHNVFTECGVREVDQYEIGQHYRSTLRFLHWLNSHWIQTLLAIARRSQLLWLLGNHRSKRICAFDQNQSSWAYKGRFRTQRELLWSGQLRRFKARRCLTLRSRRQSMLRNCALFFLAQTLS